MLLDSCTYVKHAHMPNQVLDQMNSTKVQNPQRYGGAHSA